MIVPSSSLVVCLKSDFGPVGMSTSGSPEGLASVAGAPGSVLPATGGGFLPKVTASPLPENQSSFQAANPPPPSRSARATTALIHMRRRDRLGCGGSAGGCCSP